MQTLAAIGWGPGFKRSEQRLSSSCGSDLGSQFPAGCLDRLFPREHDRVGRVQGWNMDLGLWLRTLGLSQYEGAFRESEIDAEVLPELTDQHLKDLGVALGHRLKMLRSIRELGAKTSSKVDVGSPSEPQPQVIA